MIQFAIAMFILALIAAVFGFGGLAGSFAWLAQAALVVFLIIAAASFLMSMTRSASS
ncbi:MAG: DUF1328 domain-containing protein [Myxococcales bacterium]|nr:DUF1328 domain-containing protein [Myxococcales bacterium]